VESARRAIVELEQLIDFLFLSQALKNLKFIKINMKGLITVQSESESV
jgi:hypothetical protein